jgi:hypothetical protein
MKTLFYSLLPVALFFAFIGCSDSNSGGGGSGSNSDIDVNVSACGNSVDGLLQCAINELKKEKWDEAVAYYNKAYEKDNNNIKAVIYSVLANLAKISTDPNVVTLMKDHFGFTTYPNRLNALLSDEWMKEYDNVLLPAIKTPNWVKGSGSIYDNALLSGNAMSVDNWVISLLANAIDKNSNGFNSLLDDVIDGVFGSSYNLAVERLKKLENRKGETITLDPYFVDKLDLEELNIDQYDQIGWAEVNAVLSAMLLVKASLEWVQSYDLSIDLNWLKYAWKDSPDDMQEHFKNVDARNLPFNNNFFKARPGKMANSKADYIKAIEGFQNSYTSIKNSEHYPPKVKEAYATINDGFGKLINAIKNGGKFYIPKDPTEGNWPTSQSNDVAATVDFGNFFTEGLFSLQKIFETTSAGKPVFYSMTEVCDDDYWWHCEDVYNKLSTSNYAALIDEGGMLSLRIEVIPLDSEENIIEYLPIGLEGEIAKTLFKKYYP